MKHVLSLSTLYPNAVNPRFGTFVARSLEGLANIGESEGGWRVSVVNPIGLPPVAFGRYRALSELEPLTREGGVTVHRPHFTLIPKIGARRNASAIAKAVLPLVEQIHAEQPIDLIDAQFFFPDGPAAAMLAKHFDLPLSIKARGSDISLWGEHGFAREQIMEAAERATGLLAVSEALKRDMVAMGMPNDKIAVHYTGLDRDRFRPLGHTQLRSQLGQQLGFALPANAPLLVCVGALIERKGQGIAITALPLLPEARLVLVGKGDDKGRLEQLARDLEVAERVHFAGSVDHDVMPLILSAADAMVLPTVSEGLANAWVESIACGTPVITTDVGGARELIHNDIAGRLIERTPDAVVEAVQALLAAPPHPQEVAASAERFSWENHAAELAEHYQRLVSG
ncbi:MAG: glycosyltransferase [Erythrobacter sp.]|nr:glycosyltransferase [Erythrobacter sp.]